MKFISIIDILQNSVIDLPLFIKINKPTKYTLASIVFCISNFELLNNLKAKNIYTKTSTQKPPHPKPHKKPTYSHYDK